MPPRSTMTYMDKNSRTDIPRGKMSQADKKNLHKWEKKEKLKEKKNHRLLWSPPVMMEDGVGLRHFKKGPGGQATAIVGDDTCPVRGQKLPPGHCAQKPLTETLP